MNVPPRLVIRKPRTSGIVFLILLALTILGFTLPSATLPTLNADIDLQIQQNRAESGFWGIYVQDLSSGRVLYSRNADIVFVPASNQKVITTATAIDALGSGYRFTTTLHRKGTVTNNTFQGDLIIEGSGDPSFGSIEYREANPLEAWARALKNEGITRIEGRIIGDDNIFDNQPYAEGWDISFITNESFAPPTGGLTYNDNLVYLQVQAGRVGSPPRVRSQPMNYLDLTNRVTTSARRRGRAIRIDRSIGTEKLTLRGSVGRTFRGTIRIPIADPTAFTLSAFSNALQEVGIDVNADLVDVDDLETEPIYTDDSVYIVHSSPTLRELIAEINKESNNLYAEHVFRTYGWGGTADGAERRTKAFLSKASVSTAGLRIRDGSGLSRKNMVSPETLGQLLAYMDRHTERDAFVRSLARGGERGSTLQYRLRNATVEAKTGSLANVRSLSGYITTQDGRRLAFVLLANNYTVPSYRIIRAMDGIVNVLSQPRAG